MYVQKKGEVEVVLFLILSIVIAVLTISSKTEATNFNSTSCGAYVNENSFLIANMSCNDPTPSGLIMNKTNITLDCQGYFIAGDGAGGGAGITFDRALNNITLKNCRLNGFEAGVQVSGGNWTLHNNTFFRNSISIDVQSSSSNIIINRTRITNSTNYGIRSTSSLNVTIADSYNISTTGDTIYAIYFLRTNLSTIFNNTVETWGASAMGIYIDVSAQNNISSNTITIYGSPDTYGLYVLSGSDFTTITSNSIITYGLRGTAISSSSHHSNIFNNTLRTYGSSTDSIFVGSVNHTNISYNTIITGGGIESTGINTSISFNNITVANSSTGIEIGPNSNNTLISSNIIIGSGSSTGISVEDSSHNTISFNIINSSGGGVVFTTSGGGYDTNNTVSENIISSNTSNAITLGSLLNNTLLLNNNLTLSVTNNNIISDLSGDNMINYLIYNNSFGEIKWIDNGSGSFLRDLDLRINNLQGIGLDRNMFIRNDTLSFNSSAVSVGIINASLVNISLYGLELNSVKEIRRVNDFTSVAADIRNDGTNCIDISCQNLSYTGNTLVFNTSSFSSFSASNNTRPNITLLIINSTSLNNYTTDDLNCYANITDAEGQTVSVNYTWYNNTVEITALRGQTTTVQTGNLTLINTLGAGNTTKIQNWTCSVQAHDGVDTEFDWNNITMTIRNTPPNATIPTIVPATAYTNNTLSINITYSDADNDTGIAVFQWYVNGTNVFNFTNSSAAIINNTIVLAFLDGNNFSKINLVNVSFFVNDSTDNSTTIWSNQINISNSVPEARTLNLTSTDPSNRTNGTLVANWTFFDADGEDYVSFGNETAWYNNSVEIIAFRNLTMITSGNLTKGQNWMFSIRVSDGVNISEWVNSTNLTIRNTASSINTPNISPTVAYTNTTLTVNTTYTDTDNDNATVYFRWYVNGTNVFNQTNTTITNGTIVFASLHHGNFSKLNIINVSVYANDGTDNSSELWSNQTNISNSVPEARVVVINSTDQSNRTNTTLIGNWTFFDVDEADTQQSIETAWYNNSVEVSSLQNLTRVTSGNISEGQNWTFSIRVSDGTNLSSWINSTVVIIKNTAPNQTSTIPNVSTAVGASTTLTLSSYFNDINNDDLNYTIITVPIATLTINNVTKVLTITGTAIGTASTYVNATDGTDQIQSTNFTITVTAAPVANTGSPSDSTTSEEVTEPVVQEAPAPTTPGVPAGVPSEAAPAEAGTEPACPQGTQRMDHQCVALINDQFVPVVDVVEIEKNFTQSYPTVYPKILTVQEDPFQVGLNCLVPSGEKVTYITETVYNQALQTKAQGEKGFFYDVEGNSFKAIYVFDDPQKKNCVELNMENTKKSAAFVWDIFNLFSKDSLVSEEFCFTLSEDTIITQEFTMCETLTDHFAAGEVLVENEFN